MTHAFGGGGVARLTMICTRRVLRYNLGKKSCSCVQQARHLATACVIFILGPGRSPSLKFWETTQVRRRRCRCFGCSLCLVLARARRRAAEEEVPLICIFSRCSGPRFYCVDSYANFWRLLWKLICLGQYLCRLMGFNMPGSTEGQFFLLSMIILIPRVQQGTCSINIWHAYLVHTLQLKNGKELNLLINSCF